MNKSADTNYKFTAECSKTYRNNQKENSPFIAAAANVGKLIRSQSVKQEKSFF
jgi:hypothetical protein